MNVLVLNVGSATLKFQVVVTDAERISGHRDQRLIRGQIERIGGESIITIRGDDGVSRRRTAPLRDLRTAVAAYERARVAASDKYGRVRATAWARLYVSDRESPA